MTYKLSAKKVLLAGLEVAYGVDPVLTGAQGILASNFTLKPMVATTIKRARAYPNFGSSLEAIAEAYRTISFEVEATGSGAAGTAPPYDALLQACGLSATNNVGVSEVYAPISAGQKSCAEYFFWDGLKHTLLGTRGTVALKAAGATLPQWTFTLTGLYGPLSDTAAPDVSAALAGFLNAGDVNVANTQFSIGGLAAVMDTLTIDLGNTVVFRNRPNAAYVAITDRMATGTVTIEATTVAAKDWFALAAAETTQVLQLIQGTTAGNTLEVDAPKVQLGVPDFVDLKGVLGLTIPLTFIRTNGDDELSFTIK